MLVDIMRSLHETKGVTFVFSTHDRRLLDRVDRRIQLRDGMIADDDVAPGPTGTAGDDDA